jgi:hypothetical protein
MFSECGVTRAGLELGVPKHSARRPIVGTQVVRRGPHAAGQRATRRLAARHCLDRSRSAWLDRTQNTRPRGQLTGLYSRDSKIAGAPWRSCLTNVCPLRNSSSVAEGKGEAYEICGVRPDRIAAVRVPRLASAKKSGFCEWHGSCQAGARSPAESGTIRLATEWVQWLCEACIKLPPRLSQEVTLTAEPGRVGRQSCTTTLCTRIERTPGEKTSKYSRSLGRVFSPTLHSCSPGPQENRYRVGLSD